MIIALDIETMADETRLASLPEPEVDARLVDPAKIKAAKEKNKAKQIAQAGLSPMTGRVICAGLYFGAGSDRNVSVVLPEATDSHEITLIQFIFQILSEPEVRLVTFNGNHFDLPFIYRRAMMLNFNPKYFGAPPLSAWTKRYGNEIHIDMISVWAGSDRVADFDNLADVAQAILGETRSAEDYEQFPELMKTDDGRNHIAAACLHHTELTYRIYERALGCLFA